MRRIIVAFTEVLLGFGQQQVTVLHAFHTINESVRSSEESTRLACFPSKEEDETRPKCASGGAWSVATLEVPVVCAVEDVAVLEVSTGQVRRRRKRLKIFGPQGFRVVGERE